MIRFLGCMLIGLASLALVGCGGPKTVAKINFDPEKAAAEAMAMYDASKDGKLDANELKKCPALLSALADMDKNGNKCIDLDELTARLSTFKNGNISLLHLVPRVTRGGRPVENVTVTLEPEKFLASAIKSATGVSTKLGDVQLQTDGQPYPGAQVGFYQVIVSQKDAAGKELLPAKFNNPTTLGVEVGPSNRGGLVIDLDK